MRVLLVTPYFFPSTGGVQQYVRNVASALKMSGHEVAVATTATRGAKASVNVVDGIRVYRLPYKLLISNTPFGFGWRRRLRNIVKTEKPDLIHAHAPVPGMADMAFAACGGVPFVLTYHAGKVQRGGVATAVMHIYEQRALKRMVRGSNAVGAVYPPFIQTLAAPGQTVHFAPGGIDVARFTPKNGAMQTDVLYVGRLERSSAWKGVDVLLAAVALVAKTRPEVALALVGGGDAVEGYKYEAERLGIAKNVRFTGELTGDALVQAYRQARLHVLPSKTEEESLGLVLVEAMACGIPVIGSRVGGIPNVITDGETGLLVPPNDAPALAAAILRVLADAALAKRLAARGREHALQMFSNDALLARTLKLYEAAHL